MKRGWFVAMAMLGVGACGTGTSDAQMAADTLTRREKDSIIATMPIPGASGVGRALGAVDRANARVEGHDTIR